MCACVCVCERERERQTERQRDRVLACVCEASNAEPWCCANPQYGHLHSNPLQGRNSSVGSVLGSLSCVVQRRRFNPPLR